MLFRVVPLLVLLAALTHAFPAGWETRYVLKLSTPDDRPRWQVQAMPATDTERDHLAVHQTGPAAGGLLIGRRISLPAGLADLELAATFQTFCPEANRSGSVDLGVMSPEAWDRLGRDPEAATAPPAKADWVLVRSIHANREDVQEWQRQALRGPALDSLNPWAGREVVVAVLWSTWHPGEKEWFRLAELHLGEAAPWIEADAWPTSIRTGEALRLQVKAGAPPDATLELGVRSASTPTWQWQPLTHSTGKSYTAELPGDRMAEPLDCKARLTLADGTVSETPVRKLALRQPPSHPGVFYSPAMLGAMRDRMAAHDWAKETAEGIRRGAEAWKDRTDDPPFGPGGWSHDYACPDDGARLQWREDHPHDHLCPRCSKEWQGEKLDANWRNSMHGKFVRAARDSALAAQLSGSEEYVPTARRILLWYAAHYREFPEGHGPAGRGRVMSQSLSECSWLLSFMEAADLAFPYLTAEEQRAIETGVIEPGVQQISQFHFGIHNIQCWHNACMACAGYFLGDRTWVDRGTEGKLGFHQQVEKGILPDGMWYERSLGYHSFTLSALTWQCEAARLNGDPLDQVEGLQRMCTAPLRLAFPNLVTPSLNDQGYTRNRIATGPLEEAVAWYSDPVAASALRRLYAEGAKRGGLFLLKYGSDLPTGDEYVSPGSVDMPGAGLAILRSTQADGPCAMLEYGEHGGGHGHPDKLQLILYGLGQIWCPDLGTTGYGVPLHAQWYKTTPGHNTVTIGEANQKPTTGKLLAFRTDAHSSAAVAESDGAYPGWQLRRHLLQTDAFVVDVFDVQGEKPDTVDWFLRSLGQASTDLPLATDDSPAENRTYGYLHERHSAETAESWTCRWQTEKGSLSLALAGAPGTQVTFTKAPGPAGEPLWDTLRIRRRTASTRFVAVYQFLAPGQTPRPVQFATDTIHIGPVVVSLPTADQSLPVLGSGNDSKQ